MPFVTSTHIESAGGLLCGNDQCVHVFADVQATSCKAAVGLILLDVLTEPA